MAKSRLTFLYLLGLTFALYGCASDSDLPSPGTSDPATQQALYEQGVELAQELAANDPDIAQEQMIVTPQLFGYGLLEDSLAVDQVSQQEYLTNQLIVRTEPGTTPKQVADLVAPIGGLVVGVNGALDDHQILLDDNYSVAELDGHAGQLAADPLVLQVRQNLPFTASDPQSVDPVNDPVWQGRWGSSLGNGDGSAGNWGMQAIGAPVIWDIAGELSPVTVGVFDKFYGGQINPDIEEYALYGVENLKAPEVTEANNGERTHGLHVAGTIAAGVDNGTGVAGVSPTANLLTASYDGMVRCQTSWFGNDLDGERCKTHAFAETLGFSILISQGAKAINYSMGPTNETVALAEQGDTKTRKAIAAEAQTMGQAFADLVNRGHDFLIVVSGGNESGGLSSDKKGTWLSPDADKAVTATFDQAIDTRWNAMIAMRDLHPELRDRVISVGAMQSLREDGGQGYGVGAFSNYGTDLVAPGVGIVSTMEVFGSEPHNDQFSPHFGCGPVQCPAFSDNHEGVPEFKFTQPAKLQETSGAGTVEPPKPPVLPTGYSTKSGTSMAAPHVTGVASAIWSANPELTASQVRHIILNTAESVPAISKSPRLADTSSYSRLNGAAAIRDALASRSTWHDQRDYTGIPTPLQGTWCHPSKEESCLNLVDLFASSPQAALDAELTALDPTGRTSAASTITLCLDGPCDTAQDAFKLTYYPPGAEWECVYHSELDSCDEATRDAFLPAHDISWPRIVHQVKQADGRYTDAEPLVLDLRAEGNFKELPFAADSARLPVDSRDYEGIPQELRGTWCLNSDSSSCLNFVDYLAQNPQSGIDDSFGLSFPQNEAATFVLCIAFDSTYNGKPTCSTAGSAFFTYFPATVAWNCLADGAARYGFTACDPDFTDSHRTDEPRLVRNLNHQHDRDYVDVEPMYLSPSARGSFPNLDLS